MNDMGVPNQSYREIISYTPIIPTIRLPLQPYLYTRI